MSSNGVLIDRAKIDCSVLVGKRIKINAEQFPGQVLTTRIMSTGGNNLVLDKSGSDGKISQLIQKQNANVQFEYKGQAIAFTSTIVITDGGRVLIPMAESLNPMVRRKFVRFDMEKTIRLTYFDERNIKTTRLNKLKWFETTIANIGGGGILAFMPSMLADDNFILMNMNMDNLEFPPLILGRVCHSHRNNKKKIVTGIEFITREISGKIIPSSLIRNLPEAIFQFNNGTVRYLTKYLEENNRNNIE
ncbi:MAG: hypothetical protein DRP51_03660 [Candidatus Zixiibacteriota bacterium]|nr:MAG: hypothetical protein DRP51_03660 [candidate division Zixibacteria bacterium]